MIDWPVLRRNWYFFLGMLIFSISACFQEVRENHWIALLVIMNVSYFGILFREARHENGARRIQ